MIVTVQTGRLIKPLQVRIPAFTELTMLPRKEVIGQIV